MKWYETQISILKGQIKLVQYQQNKELKASVFEKIQLYSKNIPVPSEPLTEEEAQHFKIIAANPQHCRELVELIEDKIENERREQEEFLESVRVQIYEDQVSEISGVT